MNTDVSGSDTRTSQVTSPVLGSRQWLVFQRERSGIQSGRVPNMENVTVEARRLAEFTCGKKT